MGRGTASYLLRWGGGAVRLRATPEHLDIEASNMSLRLEARMIRINGPVAGWRDVAHSRYRWVYVDFEEPVEPLPLRGAATARALILGLYEARSTDVGFERYLTVVTPGHFLYEYVVVSTKRMGISSSPKRSFFFDESARALSIYVV